MAEVTEYSIATRLREIASDLRAKARDHSKTQSPVAIALMGAMEDIAARLNEVIIDAEQPSAGTSAYQMIADMEKANVEVTETLIHMVAATVLFRLANRDGTPMDEALIVSFSPADMDAMHRAYDMDATRDGMLTTVRIIPKTPAEAAIPTSLYTLDGIDEDEAPKPQAPVVEHNRPVWAIRYYGNNGERYFALMHDRADAERHIHDYMGRYDQPEPTIENRFCVHVDCPAEHCNHEVTSGSVDTNVG